MRAIWITKARGPEVLAVRESPDPEPGRGEVRIAVRAAGLNFAEVMARQGLYPDAPKPPCVVGYEVAGVGIAVLQLCRTVPEVVTFGAASAAKHVVLREEGCTHPIDYRTEDYVARVRELTGGEGVDLVLDPLGGRDWKRGLGLLRPVGQLIAYGFANLSTGERRSVRRLVGQLTGVPLLTPVAMMDRNRTVSGVNLGHLWGRSDLLREELAALLDLWRAGAIRPRVDGVYPFEETAAAHRRIGERRNIGKVVLVP